MNEIIIPKENVRALAEELSRLCNPKDYERTIVAAALTPAAPSEKGEGVRDDVAATINAAIRHHDGRCGCDDQADCWSQVAAGLAAGWSLLAPRPSPDLAKVAEEIAHDLFSPTHRIVLSILSRHFGGGQ